MFKVKFEFIGFKKITLFFILGVLCLLICTQVIANAQVFSPFYLPFISPVPVFPTFFPQTFPVLSSLYTASFTNPFVPPATNLGFPTLPSTTNPVATTLGTLVPPPPLPVATIAGTTITAASTLTTVQVRVWLGGPPLTLSLPVPTTIFIIPSATVSGLLIPPPPIPFI